MPAVGLLPAIALAAGAAAAIAFGLSTHIAGWALAVSVAGCAVAYARGISSIFVAFALAAFCSAGWTLAGDAQREALRTPLRSVLAREFGDFDLATLGPGGRHAPLRVRGVVTEDASVADDLVTVRMRVTTIEVGHGEERVDGQVTFGIGGTAAGDRVGEWTKGRTLQMPATFRRPTRYLNDGVPDFERDLALAGTTLFGSVKSGLLVEVVSRGSAFGEAAAAVRRFLRRAVARWIAPHDAVSAAIVTAVLIGDRTGLPDAMRLRLQTAGTYHVLAISGGNIAILAAVLMGLLVVCGVTGRPAAVITLLVLVAYACVVSSGASVWRATVMAAVYLVARALDHRSPPWHAIAVAGALVMIVEPLQVRDAGFLLTFGATAALLEVVRRSSSLFRKRPVVRWIVASLAASAAAEIALLPLSAWTFSRVTSAGLVLNLLAVPLMSVVQVSGLLVCAVDLVARSAPLQEWWLHGAALAGWAAHASADAIVSTSALVEVAPWLSVRVPRPAVWMIVAYYAGLGAALALPWHVRPTLLASSSFVSTNASWRRFVRAAPLGVFICIAAAVAIVSGAATPGFSSAASPSGTLRLTVLDVGQGDSALVELPDGSTLLVDSGGIPFGSGAFDIGARVLAPALWVRGIRRLDTLVLTHGDPDHIGGARAVLDDFRPRHLWEGIQVPRHVPMRDLISHARGLGTRIEPRRSEDVFDFGSARVRVLHPPPPDWERQRVRNDDSVVLEVLYRDVALLLAGDIGADIERAIAPQLTPARTRVLKVAHHGSRTSSSRALLETWRPQIAIVSCGRGNTFGHPAADVLQRFASIGAAVYRTDLHGQITLETDGTHHVVRMFTRGVK